MKSNVFILTSVAATNEFFQDFEPILMDFKPLYLESPNMSDVTIEKHANTNTKKPLFRSQSDAVADVPTESQQSNKRRFSLDFLKFRRGSRAKFDVLKSQTTLPTSSREEVSLDPVPAPSVSRRRSSTRMEGNSELAAWCLG